MKINVLLMAPTPPDVGGIANWTDMLLKHFKDSNDVNLVAINVGTMKKKSFNMNIIQRVFYGLQDCREVLKNMKQALKNSHFDVVHITSTGSLSLFRDRKILKLAKKNNLPIIIHIRNGRFPEIVKKNGWEWKFFRKNFCYADKIIAIDKNTFELLSKCYSEKVIEILNPIDLSKLEYINSNHDYNGVLSYAGWVVPTKGIEELIASFCVLKKKRDYLTLKIIGPYNPDYYNYLKEKFDLSSIVFCGPLNNQDCLNIISNSELFVFPSYTEGCPNVVLESMLCKTPVVASNVGSIPELLDNNCGIVIESKSISSIVDGVDYLLSNKIEQLTIINNAFSKVTKELSVEAISKKYYDVWNYLIRN